MPLNGSIFDCSCGGRERHRTKAFERRVGTAVGDEKNRIKETKFKSSEQYRFDLHQDLHLIRCVSYKFD